MATGVHNNANKFWSTSAASMTIRPATEEVVLYLAECVERTPIRSRLGSMIRQPARPGYRAGVAAAPLAAVLGQLVSKPSP